MYTYFSQKNRSVLHIGATKVSILRIAMIVIFYVLCCKNLKHWTETVSANN